MRKKKQLNNIKMIIFIIVLILCIIFSIIIMFTNKNNKVQNLQSYNESSVESIVNELGSNFIKQKKSEENGYEYDIYVDFKENLYVNKKSNERLYTNLMTQVILKLKTSVRFIDKSKDLIIRVTYIPEENRYYYTINGEEDYFIKQDSIISLNNYKEIENTKIVINSSILNELISNNWKVSNNIFGTKESIFEDYDIYFDEGIKVKKISGNIFNIVFSNEYKENVLNGIKPGDSIEKIKSILGEPSIFQSNIYGYKNNDIYVFFSDNEISIYKNNNIDYTQFENILRKYINDEINIKEFINELTDLWPDYYNYQYNSSYVFLYYYTQGVIIKLDSNNPKNISILSNYENKEGIMDLIKDNKIIANFEDNGFLLAEGDRKSLESKYIGNFSNPEYIGYSEKFIEKVKENKIEFLALYDDDISCTLLENIQSYIWYSDYIFIFSVKGKGIYYFDLKTRKTNELLLGDDEFIFKDFKNGILYYDDKNIEIGSE